MATISELHDRLNDAHALMSRAANARNTATSYATTATRKVLFERAPEHRLACNDADGSHHQRLSQSISLRALEGHAQALHAIAADLEHAVNQTPFFQAMGCTTRVLLRASWLAKPNDTTRTGTAGFFTGGTSVVDHHTSNPKACSVPKGTLRFSHLACALLEPHSAWFDTASAPKGLRLWEVTTSASLGPKDQVRARSARDAYLFAGALVDHHYLTAPPDMVRITEIVEDVDAIVHNALQELDSL